MRDRRWQWLLGFLSLLLLASAAFASDYSYVRIVRLSLVDGDVQLERPDVEGWVPAAVNTPLEQGFRIYAGNGRGEIEFESGAVARLAPGTLIELKELILLSNGGRSTQIYLQQGTATFYANLTREDSFLVLTPYMQVTVPEQARFRVNVGEQATSVNVYKGEVGVDSGGGRTRVAKGQMLQLLADDPSRTYLARLPERDEWDRWNDERDDVVSSVRTNDYVPAHVRYGVNDLDRYGTWLSINNYGTCWQPYAAYDWVPFSVGKWVWYPGLGYTWVSYEPWGWLPYHYGRWAYAPGYGWVWVPGSFDRFGPGHVGWIQGPGMIAWYPLGDPRNREHGTVVTTPTGFRRGHSTPINKRPDFDPDAKPVERPNIAPDVQARMPLLPDQEGDVGGRRREIPPWKIGEEGRVDRPSKGNVVTVAPRSQPTPSAPAVVTPLNTPSENDARRGSRRPPKAGEIFFDPEQNRYVNVPPVNPPQRTLPIAPPSSPTNENRDTPRERPPVERPDRMRFSEGSEQPRRERITPPTSVPSAPRSESPMMMRPQKFERPEAGEPRMVQPPRERMAPPPSSPRIEHRPPSTPIQPPRIEPARPITPAPARERSEGARPSKRGE